MCSVHMFVYYETKDSSKRKKLQDIFGVDGTAEVKNKFISRTLHLLKHIYSTLLYTTKH